MKTPTESTAHGAIVLTSDVRALLKQAIDSRVRDLTAPRRGTACPECGANTTDLPGPVLGCSTCANRFWRRRQRAA